MSNDSEQKAFKIYWDSLVAGGIESDYLRLHCRHAAMNAWQARSELQVLQEPVEVQIKAAQEVFEEWFCEDLGLELESGESDALVKKMLIAAKIAPPSPSAPLTDEQIIEAAHSLLTYDDGSDYSTYAGIDHWWSMPEGILEFARRIITQARGEK